MKKSLLKFIVCNLFVLSSWSALAQFPGSEDSSGTGNLESADSQAPISDYIIPMLLIGIVIGYRLLKQKKLIAK